MAETDPVIRCWNDAKALLTTTQLAAWQRHIQAPGGSNQSRRLNLFNAWYYELLNCTGTKRRSQILAEIGMGVQQTAAKVEAGGTQVVGLQEYLTELYEPRGLADANLAYASELFSEAPMQLVRDIAAQVGVRVDQSEIDTRAGVAIYAAGVATTAGDLLPVFIERAGQTAGAAGGSFWDKFTSGLKKLFTHPGDWLQRVFVTEPGKAIQWAGRQLMSLQKNAWTKWLIDPLGVFRQLGAFFRELGHAMIEGSITAFEEQTFAKENAKHWREVGAALAVAAPFLPPPFNVIALGLSAAFIAAGTAILAAYANAEAERQAEKQAKLLAARADARAAAAATAAQNAAYVQQLENAAAGATREVVLGPDEPAQGGKLLGLDFKAVAVLASAALIWGFYGKG